jgi:hypothetical protein
MHRGGGDALVGEMLHDAVGAVLRTAEDEHGVKRFILQKLSEELGLPVLWYRVDGVRHGARSL